MRLETITVKNDLNKLLSELAETENWIKNHDKEAFVVALQPDWLVIHTANADKHDYMRLEQALRQQIQSKQKMR